jgi:O-antigen ligase
VPLGLAAGVAAVERVKVWRYAGFAGVGVLALLIMLTQSRGAMLALATAVLFLVISSRKRTRDMMLLVGMFAVAAVSAPKGVWTRLAGLSNASVAGGMQNVDPEGSAAGRWQIWQIAAATIRDNPVTGVGAGMMPYVHQREALRRGEDRSIQGARDTHSTYLKIGAETGVPGLLLYGGMWASLFVYLRRVRKTLKRVRPKEYQMLLFLELAMVAHLVAATFGSFGWLSFTYLTVAVAWLSASILEREPWYVPAKLSAGQAVAAPRRSR